MVQGRPQQRDEASLARGLMRVILFTALAGSATVVLYAYLGWRTGAWQFYALALDSGAYLPVAVVSFILARRGRVYPALYLMSLMVMVVILVGSALVAGLGTLLGLALLLIFPALLAQLMLPPRHALRLIGASILVGVLALALDFYWPGARLQVAEEVNWLFVGIALAGPLWSLFVIFRQFRWYSLRAKLIIAFVVASLLPLVIITGIVNFRATRILRAQADQMLTTQAELLATQVDQLLDLQRTAVRSEAQFGDFARFLREPDNTAYRNHAQDLLKYLARRTYVSSYGLLDAQGRNLLDSDPLLQGQDEAATEYVAGALQRQNILRQPEPYISHVVIDPETGASFFYIACGIANPETGAIIGILRVRYQAETLQTWVAQSNNALGEGSFGMLVDDTMIRLAHGRERRLRFTLVAPVDEATLAQYQAAHRLPPGSAEELIVARPELAAALQSDARSFLGEVGDTLEQEEDTELEQAAIVPLQHVPWKVVYAQSQRVFLAPVQTQTRALLFLSLFIAGVMALLGWWMALFLTRPVRDLTTMAERLAAGELDVSVTPTTGDEIGVLAEAFNGMTARLRELILTLEQRVAERTADLSRRADYANAAAEVINAVTALLEPDELMRKTATLLVDRFGFNHVAFLLLEEGGREARYHIGAGQGAEVLMQENFRLSVGGASLVGQALLSEQMQVAQDVTQASAYYGHRAIPDTRAEVVIPLVARGHILGVLSVQSKEVNAFDQATLSVLQTIAAQVAVGLDNARLLREAQQALEAERRAYGEVSRTAWQELLRAGLTPGYRYVSERVQAIGDVWHPEMTVALHEDRTVTAVAEDAPDLLTFAAPLRVRGQTIGVLNLRKPALSGRWHPEEIRLLEALIAQLEVALDSARLYQDTQRRAAREQELGEVAAQFARSLDVDTLLRTAVQELGRLPGVAEVSVHILPPAASEDKA